MKSLLIDVGPLSCECTDHALDTIHKALSEDQGDGLLWRPHHDPYVRDQIESVTRRGLIILQEILDELKRWLQGRRGELRKAQWGRWNRQDLDEIRSHLESKAQSEYDIGDWMLLVDWIVQRYLPDGVIQEEAEYMAVRGVLLGTLQATMAPSNPDIATVARAAAALPATLVAADRVIRITPVQQTLIDFAKARAAELITDIGDRTRYRIKQLIIQHEQARVLGDRGATVQDLESRLFDEFSILNRDWRRVAITETARNANEGFIASLPDDTRVRRVEAYAGACAFCRKINGMEFRVVSPANPKKDGWRQVWVGKTNAGRAASPRKRVGDELVERTPDEMWWPAAGAQHPNCRGTWQVVSDVPADVDPEFAKWIDGVLGDSHA